MRRSYFLILSLLMVSCSSYNSIDGFYETHKNDNQVVAFRVPRFMFALLRNINPEMDALVANTKDLRYMRFPSSKPSQAQFLNGQMNQFIGGSFIEVFRKNDDLKRNIVAIREKRDAVKEILIYNNNNVNGSFLYFSGDFDSAKVRRLANNQDFESFTSALLPQMNLKAPDTFN